MQQLPECIGRSKPLLASKLGIGLQCPLRYLLETENGSWTQLPESMVSCFGRAVHAVIAEAAPEVRRNAGRIRACIDESFIKLVAEQGSAMIVSEAIRAIQSATTFLPASIVVERAGLAIRLLLKDQERSFEGSKDGATGRSTGGPAGSQRSLLRFGPEVPMESRRLELVGRADMIENLKDGTVRITEFKTGAALDRDEIPTVAAHLQVCAYALMWPEKWATLSVRVMTPRGEWEAPFTAELRQQAEAAIGTLVARLPRDRPVDVLSSAQPGSICLSCRHRRSCSRYREWAVVQWQHTTVEMPKDSWGEIEEIDALGESLAHVRIRDAAGRRVCITNVPKDLIAMAEVGAYLEAFELESMEIGRKRAFPQNFFIADSRRPYQSAFSVGLFVH